MGSFETAKRQAVPLERSLEEKVAKYQQLVQAMDMEAGTTTNAAELHALSTDIPSTAAALQDLMTNKLQPAAVTSSQRAVVARYHDVCRDLLRDYESAQSLYSRRTERHELLHGASTAPGSNGSNTAMDHLLRERNHISNSLSTSTAVLGQAEAIRGDLHSQGRTLRGTAATIGRVVGSVPGINTVIEHIRRRRRSDDTVVAMAIAVCIVFTLWYVFG